MTDRTDAWQSDYSDFCSCSSPEQGSLLKPHLCLGAWASAGFFSSRCLYAFRHSSACLCIASLLISNVAGWLHVGCVGSTGSCCTAPRPTVSDSEAEATTCCNHSHGDQGSCQAEDQHPETASGGSCHSDSAPCQNDGPDEHDSERCSICQSFFSLRNGFVTSAPVITDFGDAGEIISLNPVRVCHRTILDDSISVRGPPRV